MTNYLFCGAMLMYRTSPLMNKLISDNGVCRGASGFAKSPNSYKAWNATQAQDHSHGTEICQYLAVSCIGITPYHTIASCNLHQMCLMWL